MPVDSKETSDLTAPYTSRGTEHRHRRDTPSRRPENAIVRADTIRGHHEKPIDRHVVASDSIETYQEKKQLRRDVRAMFHGTSAIHQLCY